MASLLENLLSGGTVKRQDNRRLTIIKRPIPSQPRQLFGLFSAMGNTASFQGLLRGIQMKDADPHLLTFIALNRWPTNAELANLADPYDPSAHLLSLLRSQEFRTHFVRRTFEAFPERQRLMFVHIPRSAGQTARTSLGSVHPLMPTDLAAPRFDDRVALIEALGHVFARLNSSKALAVIQTSMAPFVEDPAGPPHKADPLAWCTPLPPCRPGDVLGTVVRDPAERALSHINAMVASLRSGADAPTPALQARLSAGGPNTRRNLSLTEWRQIARDMLSSALPPNPLCHALADGTAAETLQACARSPIQLVALSDYNAWARIAFDTVAPDPVPPVPQVLRPEDLSAPDRAIIDQATAEDRIVTARFATRRETTGLPAVPGREL